MHNTPNGVLTDAERFAHVESLVARYPAITDVEVEDLKRWFDKEASAFDVATLASKEAIHSSYMAFRGKHVDAFRAKDYGAAATAIAIAAALIFYLAHSLGV